MLSKNDTRKIAFNLRLLETAILMRQKYQGFAKFSLLKISKYW